MHPQIDPSTCMREANFTMRALSSSIKANGEIDDSVSHALSLVWKYVVLTVDQCLHSQELKYSNLKAKFDTTVEMVVDEKLERYEHDRLLFEQ